MNNKTEGIGKVVSDQYRSFGEYTNLHRHIPNIEDGCKMSYRHLIQTAYEQPDSMTKTAALVGSNMKSLHPHGDMSQKDIVTELVRNGIFDGQGNFGCEFLIGGDAEAAAMRYTECKLSKNYRSLISQLYSYVPKFINELNHEECEYLPVPIPVGLTIGYLGIGFGTGCRIPAFTPESLLDAYIADDPWLLKSKSGVLIESKSQMKDLWETGRGRVYFRINTYEQNGSYYVEGKRGPIKVNFDDLIAWKDDGRVDYDDETSNGIPKIGFYKMPRVQWPTFDEIKALVDKAVQGSESYLLRVVKNNQVIDIGLRNWLDFTYNNYSRMLKDRVSDKISELEKDIEFYSHFRNIADMMLNCPDKEYSEIASDLGLDVSLVERASTRTLSTLRKYDPRNKVNQCKDQIKEYKKFDVDQYIKNCVSNM